MLRNSKSSDLDINPPGHDSLCRLSLVCKTSPFQSLWWLKDTHRQTANRSCCMQSYLDRCDLSQHAGVWGSVMMAHMLWEDKVLHGAQKDVVKELHDMGRIYSQCVLWDDKVLNAFDVVKELHCVKGRIWHYIPSVCFRNTCIFGNECYIYPACIHVGLWWNCYCIGRL